MFWTVLMNWLAYAASLAALAIGQTSEGPPFFVTYGDGRQFQVQFKATRIA